MIGLSKTARYHVACLTQHYENVDRPEAVRNLRRCLARALNRIETQQGQFFPAPRPYPACVRPGWLWLKEGAYWFSFVSQGGRPVIQSVFHESADIPKRL